MTLEEDLLRTLKNLTEKEFGEFKWYLKQEDTLEGFPAIPVAHLEMAERCKTVDLMVQKHQEAGALKITLKVLEKISRNDLVQRLQTSSPEPTDLKTLSQKGEYDKKKTELEQLVSTADRVLYLKTRGDQKEYDLKSIQQFAVDVTLDPDTAHPYLILSADGKQVQDSDVRQKLSYNPKRFKSSISVLGMQSFSSGRFYFEVQVKGKTAWTVGVATESINRKEKITLGPDNGFWTVWLRKGHKYYANDIPAVGLSLKSHPQKVGVFVDYEKGLVSFYDVDTADQLYSFTGWSFIEKLYPFFSPCSNDGGRNSAPLIICPVNPPLNIKTHDFGDQKEYEKRFLVSGKNLPIHQSL